MSALLPAHLFASFCLDGSLAVIAGLLLAERWLHAAPQGCHVVSGRAFGWALFIAATVLTLAACAQEYVLTAEFSGQRSFAGCLAEMPGMLQTYAGRVDAAGIVCALALLGASRLPLRPRVRPLCMAVLLGILLGLRSASGHAAVDGAFSVSEVLQLAHLGSMALWSGGILVTGFGIASRLGRAVDGNGGRNASPGATTTDSLMMAGVGTPFRSYMQRLSQASTWAVTLVFLTGALKSYQALGGTLHQLQSAAWGRLLIAKVSCVALALGCGALNRFWLTRTTPWDQRRMRHSVTALRVEAAAMLAVLLLSAALGSVDPPDLP